VKQFGIDLATALAQAGINPATEPRYFGDFVFNNWERPFPGVVVPLPNKFVPYVAARKKGQPANTPTIPPSPPDQPAPGVLQPMTMDYQHKLAYAFGFTKNAMLLATGKPIEPMDGHVNWALGHADHVVQSEIASQCTAAINYISGDPSPFNLINIFAYMKAAMLISSDPPVTPDTQPLEGHIHWALMQPATIVVKEVKSEYVTLRDANHLAF
jgi:hypothetical protein